MNEHQPPEQSNGSDELSHHPLATGVGTAGGGVTGAALGHSIAGKFGAVVGGVAGAIAGNVVGHAIAEFTEELIQETNPSLGLGADTKDIELPAHYSWEELQLLSKPQPGES